ncbi:MAG: hypothetical protein H7839_03530 [Magnetococcus sp. YQC-5]
MVNYGKKVLLTCLIFAAGMIWAPSGQATTTDVLYDPSIPVQAKPVDKPAASAAAKPEKTPGDQTDTPSDVANKDEKAVPEKQKTWNLQLIRFSEHPLAIINEKIVHPSEEVDGLRIVSISRNEIVGTANEETVRLSFAERNEKKGMHIQYNSVKQKNGKASRSSQ